MILAAFCGALIIAGFGGEAAAADRNGHLTTPPHSITVRLDVRKSLGVSLRGEPSSIERVIRIGDPAEGLVTYVMLDD